MKEPFSWSSFDRDSDLGLDPTGCLTIMVLLCLLALVVMGILDRLGL
jgi:hypothetical protein